MASTSLKMLKRNRGQLERTRKQRTVQTPTPGSRVFVAGLRSPQPQPPQQCPHPLPLHQSVSPLESNSCNSNKPRREGLDLLHNSSSSNLPLNNNLHLNSSNLPLNSNFHLNSNSLLLNNNLHLNSNSLPLNNNLLLNSSSLRLNNNFHLNRVLPGHSCSSQLFSSSRHKVSF